MKELESILKSIKNKEFQPIYFFHGEEPYFIDVAVKAFENGALDEDAKAFNQTVIYGRDTTYEEVFALARQFPMMGDKQLVIVKEAQDIRLTEKNSDAILKYIENPVESTILVIAYKYKKVDGRKKFLKLLSKNQWLYQSDPVKEKQLAPWIQSQMTALGIKFKPEIPRLLGEYLGTDLSRVSNELNKLKLVLKPDELLDGNLVEIHIGISKDFNVFELQKALGEKNADKAMRIAFYMEQNMKNNPLPMIIGALFSYFCKIITYHTMKGQPAATISREMGIPPFYLGEYEAASKSYPMKRATGILSILREIDMKGKGIGTRNTDQGELLTELVYKIVNIDRIIVKH